MAPCGQHLHRAWMAQGQDAEETAAPSEHRAAGEGRPWEAGPRMYTPSEGRVCDESEPRGTDPAPSLREVRGENQMVGTQEEGPTEH